MTATPRPPQREPLTPEEREMAARLARLGPHEGPSAALDARILAAAHAAAGTGAVPRRRGVRRVLALPAGWLTGAGLAASLALVLGVVWQLRPPDAVVAGRDEAPLADGGFVPAQPVPSGRPRVVAPAAPPTESTAAAPVAARVAEPQVRTRAAAQESAPAAADAVSGRPGDTASDAAPDAASDARAFASDSPVAAPPPAPPAPAVTAAPQAAAESAGSAAEEHAHDAAMRTRERRHSYTTRARAGPAAMAESRALRQQAARESAAMQSDAATSTPDGLTGDDSPAAWFAEVRRQRDQGEIDAARAVLVRFLQARPSHEVPDDLRPLLPAPQPAP